MACLGNQERQLRFVHVAGTKGKGSVCAFTARVLEEAGYTVGLYISPSLVDVGERISVNGTMLSPEDFLARAPAEVVDKDTQKLEDLKAEEQLIATFLHGQG